MSDGDLSPAQNARLRAAIEVFRREHGDERGPMGPTALRDAIRKNGDKISQPPISDIINKKSGASFKTAQMFARLFGVDVVDLIGPPERKPGEQLDLNGHMPERMAATSTSDPKIGSFLIGLQRAPGLEKWCIDNPGAVRVSQVIRAIETYPDAPALTFDPKTGPVAGWASYFQALDAGDIGRPTVMRGTSDAALELERAEHPDLPQTHALKALPPPPKGKPRRERKR